MIRSRRATRVWSSFARGVFVALASITAMGCNSWACPTISDDVFSRCGCPAATGGGVREADWHRCYCLQSAHSAHERELCFRLPPASCSNAR